MSYQVVGSRAKATQPAGYQVVGSRAKATTTGGYQVVGSRVKSQVVGSYYQIVGSRARTLVDYGTVKVEPFAVIALPSGSTWTQLSGPTVLMVGGNTFQAPASSAGATVQFGSGGSVITIQVYPHTLFLPRSGPDDPLYGRTG
jgi:hypothetical protein